MKFLGQIPVSRIFQEKEGFLKSLNTFGDIAFFLIQCTAWKWEISNFSHEKSFHLTIAKLK